MQFLRKILFYIFATIYVILCPVLILYALGYIYSPESAQGFIKTGVIYLSTNPSGATVSVDGDLFAQKTPALIQELREGEYSVNVALDGYKTWDAVLPVEKEKATALDKILLVPKKWRVARILGGPFENIIPIPDSGYLLLTKASSGAEAVVYGYKNDTGTPLFAESDVVKESTITGVSIAPGSSDIIVRMETPGDKKIFWVKLFQDKTVVKDVTELLSSVSQDLRWTGQAPGQVFFLAGGEITKIDLEAGAVYPGLIKGAVGFGLSGGNIYVVGEKEVYKTDYSAKEKEVVLDDPTVFSGIFDVQRKYEVFVYGSNYLVFLDDKGALLANKLPYKFVDSGTVGVEYNSDEERLLIVRHDSLGILDFSEEETGTVAFEKGPKLVWVCEKETSLQQAFLAYDASHTVYRLGSTISFVEIEAYNVFRKESLFTVKAGTSVYYSEEEGKVYFLDSKHENLNSITVVPQTSILPNPFGTTSQQKKKNMVEQR